MFEFVFWCPKCSKATTATADPGAVLFGGTSDMDVTCSECLTVFRAGVVIEATGPRMKLKEANTDAAE